MLFFYIVFIHILYSSSSTIQSKVFEFVIIIIFYFTPTSLIFECIYITTCFQYINEKVTIHRLKNHLKWINLTVYTFLNKYTRNIVLSNCSSIVYCHYFHYKLFKKRPFLLYYKLFHPFMTLTLRNHSTFSFY